jgi:hypothetical protein
MMWGNIPVATAGVVLLVDDDFAYLWQMHILYEVGMAFRCTFYTKTIMYLVGIFFLLKGSLFI